MSVRNKILVIAGPTASGKSSLAIELARKYNGEVISADSRQIYCGMDIGTGKVTRDTIPCHPELVSGSPHNSAFLSEGIPHHLLDIANPNNEYNVTDFIRDAQVAITDIQTRGKLPIICGGTGFWIQALVENQEFPGIGPDWQLREKLATLPAESLFAQLQTLNPKRAETIDKHNPVRLIRAIEIAHSRNKENRESEIQNPLLLTSDYLLLILNPPFETLKMKIQKRLDERFNEGMIDEIRRLHEEGASWERLERFGLEYRWIAFFLQGKIAEVEMREKLYYAIVHYAKRQLTWLRRWERQGAHIRWFTTAQEVLEFLEKEKS